MERFLSFILSFILFFFFSYLFYFHLHGEVLCNGLCHLSCLECVCGKILSFYLLPFYLLFFLLFIFYLHGEVLCNWLCPLSWVESVCGKVLSSQETSACVLGIHKQYTVFRPLIPFI